MDKKYYYSYHARGNKLSMVVSDESGKTLWSVSYPTYIEDKLTGTLVPEQTPIELGLMKNLEDVEGLSILLHNEDILPMGSEIEKKKFPEKAKIKLVVADEHTLGYIIPETNSLGVLHSSILRGSPLGNDQVMAAKPLGIFSKIRPASEKDFDDYGVMFDGYKNSGEYEYDETKLAAGAALTHAPETAQNIRILADTSGDEIIDEVAFDMDEAEKRFAELKQNPKVTYAELFVEEYNAYGYVKSSKVVKIYKKERYAEGGMVSPYDYGDRVEFIHNDKRGYIKDVKKVGDEFTYTVIADLDAIKDVPASSLRRYNSDVAEQVQVILDEKQKKKLFKDVGKRVSGSAKEKRAYSMITFADLKDIEDDEITAMQLVTKQKVYPEINVAEQRAAGVSSGAVYLKTKLREACGTKPPNSKQKRASFILFIANITKIITPLKRVEQVRQYLRSISDLPVDEIIAYFIDDSFFSIDEEKKQQARDQAKKLFGYMSAYGFIKKLLEEVFSKRFANFIYNGSDAASEAYAQSYKYESISDEESAALVVKFNEQKKKFIAANEEKLKEYTDADHKILLHSLMPNWNSGIGRFKTDLEGFRKFGIEYYQKRIDKAKQEVENTPASILPRPDDWSWFEADKTVKEKTRSGELRINSGTPLSYIKRTKGIVIENKYVDEATNTDPEKNPIIRDFGFKSVQFGISLKDIEAKEHIRHFLGAIMDLAEALDIDIKNFNHIGGLSMAFASRGKGGAMAHYEQGRAIINLTNKKGDGTVAHEFGHYFDNALTIYDKEGTVSLVYATDNPKQVASARIAEKVKAITDFFDRGKAGVTPNVMVRFVAKDVAKLPRYYDEIEKKFVELQFLDNIEDTFKKLQAETRIFKTLDREYFEKRIEMAGAIIKHFELKEFEVEFTSHQSAYRFYSSKMNSKYWTATVELFARAWETFIFDRLQSQGRMNNYLVAGEYFQEKIPLMSGGYTYVYPFGEERKYLYILYSELVQTVKEVMGLKSFVAPDAVREDQYIIFEKDAEREVVGENDEVEVEVEKMAGGALIAPNGKKSNLTKEQWHLVRTAEFKEWFGDWENEPEKASKVIDENGEPKITYHGSSKTFSVFDRKKLGNHKHILDYLGFHFTGSEKVAEAFFMKADSKIYECFLSIKEPFISEENIIMKESLERGVEKGFINVPRENIDLEKLFKKPYYDLTKGSWGNDVALDAWGKGKSMLQHDKIGKNYYKYLMKEGYDGIFYLNEIEWGSDKRIDFIVFEPSQIKLADGTNTKFDVQNNDIRFAGGGDVTTVQDAIISQSLDVPQKQDLILEDGGSVNEEQINKEFNKRISEIADEKNKNYSPLELGYPSEILLSAGFPYLPIELSVKRLLDKKFQENHPFDIEDVTDMPERLANPIAVFESRTRDDSKVVLTEMQHDGINFVVAIHLYRLKNHEEINDIRSIYPKDNVTDVLRWIAQHKLMLYCNKQKALNWLDKQQSDSAEVIQLIKDGTKIIKDFENPKLDFKRGGKPVNQPDKKSKQRSNSAEVTRKSGGKAKIKKFIPPPKPTAAEQKIIDKNLKRRWRYKRDAIYTLRDNIDKLKRRVREDLKSDDEKTRLTALITRVMICTSERIGNDNSRDNGHYGICGFRPSQVTVEGDKIFLKYKGKSGVMHEREFSDAAAADLLDKLKERKNGYIFTTETGFRVRPDRVNRYLDDFGITSKDIRGFNANRQMVMKLKNVGVTEEKERKHVFNDLLRKVAAKIGHTPATLRKHYLLPEIEKQFYGSGTVAKIEIE